MSEKHRMTTGGIISRSALSVRKGFRDYPLASWLVIGLAALLFWRCVQETPPPSML